MIQQKWFHLYFLECKDLSQIKHCVKYTRIRFSLTRNFPCDALRDLVPFIQFKKHEKKNHAGVLILVKLQKEACNSTKINTPAWVFFTFIKLYKCYQIAQRITYKNRIAESVLVREIRVRENRILLFFVQWKVLTEKLLERFSASNFHS